ncbi:tyrosine-type recombinase/integrase [Escherichia coli]
MMNPVPWLQMTNMISYQGLVRTFPSINQVIKRIGYEGRLTGHGFRHMLSTILHEEGFQSAFIEVQLAHVDRNNIRGTYNHAIYLMERQKMMQWYSDYLRKKKGL